jgi:hypothetical protein
MTLLFVHFFIRVEIKSYQTFYELSTNVCPIDGCGLTFSGESEVVRHFGIDHCAVIDKYSVQVRGSPAGAALAAYKKSFGFEELVCDWKVNNGTCG